MTTSVFQKIRYRLLLSYLVVLTIVLGVFAIAVRITFTRSLNQQLIDRLESLARASALNLGLKDANPSVGTPSGKSAVDAKSDEVEVDTEEALVSANQGIQWFDTEGNLLEEQGDYVLELPFSPQAAIETQITPYSAKGLTIRVNDSETGTFVGYTRVSESTQTLDDTLRHLDLGLAGGATMALLLSALGGIWLTRQAMQPIEKSFQRLQQFTADASHELRNPLMAIKSNAAVALKYPENIRVLDAEKFEAIASASTQMTSLIEDLLLLARTDQALPQKQRDNVNLTLLLKELVQLYRAEAELKHIHIKEQIHSNLEVLGEATELNRLFSNLMSNALRYTPEQGCIEITTQTQGSHIVVSVQDTGIGMAPEQLEHVLDRFWRGDRARSYGSGFGLGLAIAQNIAKNHGGSITVTSQLGKGSCFTVKLPIDAERGFRTKV